jgi:hypothetical protein
MNLRDTLNWFQLIVFGRFEKLIKLLKEDKLTLNHYKEEVFDSTKPVEVEKSMHLWESEKKKES